MKLVTEPIKGSELVLNLGFSHDVNYKIPDGISITTEGQNQITNFWYRQAKS